MWTYVAVGVLVLPHSWPAAFWWQMAGLPLVIAIGVALQGVGLAPDAESYRVRESLPVDPREPKTK